MHGVAFALAFAVHILLVLLVAQAMREIPCHAVYRQIAVQPIQLRLSEALPMPAAPPLPPPPAAPPRRSDDTPTPTAAVEPTPPAALNAATPRNAPAPAMDTIGDGGFQERLRAAHRAGTIRRLPGTGESRVPGIHLIDPAQQGVSHATRQLQRLFGITRNPCVDVDVWRHLSTHELLAKHLTPDDVEQVAAKNDCERPAGLSF